MKDIDIAWNEFQTNGILKTYPKVIKKSLQTKIPKCSKIYISTQTKICFLNNSINIKEIFWQIPVLRYSNMEEGVIKKQIKTVCMNVEESIVLDNKIKKEKCVYVDIISSIKNPTARKIKYKDIRKINIGFCKKDLISHRKVKKGAFYNCIVLIIRIKKITQFKEFHVKIFNTGKLELPGIKFDTDLYCILNKLIQILQPFVKTKLQWKKDDIDTVLINSNFNCGFYLDRTKLYSILKYKYKLHTIYDSCSYPGIQCKFYYNLYSDENNGICKCHTKYNHKQKTGNKTCLEISFMVFRTGSILIVGHCDIYILKYIYNFIKQLLAVEYHKIKMENVQPILKRITKKKKKFIIIQTTI